MPKRKKITLRFILIRKKCHDIWITKKEVETALLSLGFMHGASRFLYEDRECSICVEINDVLKGKRVKVQVDAPDEHKYRIHDIAKSFKADIIKEKRKNTRYASLSSTYDRQYSTHEVDTDDDIDEDAPARVSELLENVSDIQSFINVKTDGVVKDITNNHVLIMDHMNGKIIDYWKYNADQAKRAFGNSFNKICVIDFSGLARLNDPYLISKLIYEASFPGVLANEDLDDFHLADLFQLFKDNAPVLLVIIDAQEVGQNMLEIIRTIGQWGNRLLLIVQNA